MFEPRRSGRATKGQHTKNQELDEPPKQTSRKTGPKTKAKPSNSQNEGEEEDEANIRCVCGATEDEAGWMMVSCEKCSTWQHNLCMAVTEDSTELEKVTYYCEICKPGMHKELLAAMKKSEKPWEVRIAKRKEDGKNKKKGKKTKSGRPSGAGNEKDSGPSSPQPTITEPANKRKFESITAKSEFTDSSSPAKPTSASEQHRSKRNKSVSHNRRDSTSSSSKAQASSSSPVFDKLHEVVHAGVDTLIKTGLFHLAPDASLDDLALKVANDINKSLEKLASPNQATQFYSIVFNIPQNPDLIHQILAHTLTPDELVTMKSEDMASKKLQDERAAIKEETVKQATLVHQTSQPTGPRYRKTHKGEELVEELAEGESFRAEPAEMSPTFQVNVSSLAESPTKDTLLPAKSPPQSESADNSDGKSSIASAGAVQPANDFNIQNVWKNIKTDNTVSAASTLRRKSSIKQDSTAQSADANAERLMRDDDNDYNTVDESGPTRNKQVLWRGEIVMRNVGAFKATAEFACGTLPTPCLPITDLLRPEVEISHRSDSAAVSNYVSSVRSEPGMDVFVCAITIPKSGDDQTGFITLFNYLKQKERWGVISERIHPSVNDVYMAPVEPNTPLPAFMATLPHQDLVTPLPYPTFLLIIVTDRASTYSQMPVLPNVGTPAILDSPQTPMNTHIPDFSPLVPNERGDDSSLTLQNSDSNDNGAVELLIHDGTHQSLERAILGEYYFTPVAQELTKVVKMDPLQLQNMRDTLHLFPETRNELQVFANHVKTRADGPLVAEQERSQG